MRLAAALAVAGALVSLLPAAGSGAPATVTLTVVVSGQGRVTSEPAGLVDCTASCTVPVAPDAVIVLRSTPVAGSELAERHNCLGAPAEPLCTVAMRASSQRVDVFFAPSGRLLLWPAGDGALRVSPVGTNDSGLPPLSDVCDVEAAGSSEGCAFRYPPGTDVTVTATAAAGSTFLGWSSHRCPGTGACTVDVPAEDAALVGRFSPLELRIRLGGNDTGSIRSEPPGIACPPTCEAPFPTGTSVTLIAQPDPAFPFVSWKFGCAVSPSDPRRCTAQVVSRPTWVGIAMGQDDEVGLPATVTVLFGVERDGRGTVAGSQIDCGTRCAASYLFGREETLRARPDAGWRFTTWQGACERRPSCTLLVGPVTSLGARFTENLVPRLRSLAVRRLAGRRAIVARVSVTHAATAVVRVRRLGAAAALPARTFRIRGGTTTLVRPLARSVPAGRYRVTVSLSDGLGGGRTFTRTRAVGRP